MAGKPWGIAAAGLALLLALAETGLPAAGAFLAPPQPGLAGQVDLLVILGGGWEFREITGAALFRAGYARRILLTGIPPARDGEGHPVKVPAFDHLLRSGIPAGAILLDGSARNTWEEIAQVRAVLAETGGRRVAIVTDPPHLRRLDWVCRGQLAAHGIRYTLVPTLPDWWSVDRWWTNPVAARFVGKEALKSTYYLFRYGLSPT